MKPTDFESDSDRFLYKKDEISQSFVLILEGQVEMEFGKSKFNLKVGSFFHFGESALESGEFVPDFSVKIVEEILFLEIKFATFSAAVKDSAIKNPIKIFKNSSVQKLKRQSSLVLVPGEARASISSKVRFHKNSETVENEILGISKGGPNEGSNGDPNGGPNERLNGSSNGSPSGGLSFGPSSGLNKMRRHSKSHPAIFTMTE